MSCPIWYFLSAQSVGPTRKQSLAREGAVLSPLSSGNARALYGQEAPGVRLRKYNKISLITWDNELYVMKT